jgi:hypothetical protein
MNETPEQEAKRIYDRTQKIFRESAQIRYKNIPTCYGESMYFYDMVHNRLSKEPNYYAKLNSSENAKKWNDFMKSYQPGDDLYIFVWNPPSIDHMSYSSGIMIVRNGIVIDKDTYVFA